MSCADAGEGTPGSSSRCKEPGAGTGLCFGTSKEGVKTAAWWEGDSPERWAQEARGLR